jgi:rod shape-determining protein MreC
MNNALSMAMTPAKNAATILVRQAERLYNYIFSYDLLEAENDQLRLEMAQQNQNIRNSQTYKEENEQLRSLLNLADKHTDFTYEIANVVSWDSSSYGSVMTISKGSSAGLEAGMCAITADGQVLGLIGETGTNWATVTTILDTTSEIGAYIFGSGYTCIAQGDFELMREGTLKASYISSSATIRNGDQLLTSGDGDIYPAGLVIGSVTDVGNDEINVAKYAVISPTVDIQTVEQVFIIKSFDVND